MKAGVLSNDQILCNPVCGDLSPRRFCAFWKLIFLEDNNAEPHEKFRLIWTVDQLDRILICM